MEGVQRVGLRTYLKQSGEFKKRLGITGIRKKWARGEPVALTLTALAPQLFRDLVVRYFCVSRFTVNKKAQKKESLAFAACSLNVLGLLA